MTTHLRDGSADNADSVFPEFAESDFLPGVDRSQDDPNALAGNGTAPYKYLTPDALIKRDLRLLNPELLRDAFSDLYARKSQV